MPQLPQSIVNTTKNAYYNTYPYGPQEMGDAYPELADTGKSTTSSNNFFSSGVGFGTIRQIGNNIMGGAVNKQYDYLNSPYSQQVKDLFDATQDPIARAIKNWTGKSRDNILSAIHEDTPNEDLFKFSISGNDNASLLNNFNYRQHSDEELGIRQNIRQKDFWSAFGDFNNQAGVGALYGAEMGGGWGALAGLATGIGMGINNWIYDSKNTKRFNNAINQGNMLKRMREKSYQDDYLAQYSNQVNDVANMNYRNNIRDYYGILRNGGKLRFSGWHKYASGGNPDWDPDNPYHYHTASGEKVVITPEDWEKHKGQHYFKQIEDAVLTEQAAYPGPEYIINPQFSKDLRRVYKGNMGPLYQNYSSFFGNLPQGYSFTPEGLVQDNQGNLYVQKGFRQTPRFTYDESNPLTFPVFEGRNRSNVTFYPVNMEKTIKPTSPVDTIMNVEKQRQNAIKDYLINNRQRLYKTPYVTSENGDSIYAISYPTSNNSDVLHVDWLQAPNYTDIIDTLPYVSKSNNDMYTKRLIDISNNRGMGSGFEFNRNMVVDNVGKIFSPSYADAVQNAVIDTTQYKDGGSIHIKPENRGKFTALKERTGHSATWFKENGTPAQKKMAVFALNARKWHHNDNGGPLTDEQYFKIMERVAKKNYTDWGFNTPDEALTHALNDNTYNYRAFYNENPEAMNDANTHWPDTYKTVYHPTFSDESKYSGVVDKNYNPYGRIGGVWARGTFFPNYWQTKYRNGGELGTMDDINNGFIDIVNGGTHEENPLGGVPVNIAEDGLPNLVEEGEMIYDGYVYSNNPQLAPSKDLQKGIGIQGKTYADLIRKAQQYSSERPNDPIAKNFDKYIASIVAAEQETQKQEKQSNMKNRKGIKGHYADWGADLAYYSPLIGTAGQMISDWVGNTNQYDYSGINRAVKEAGTLQAPTYASYYDAGTKAKYNPYDSNYIFNPINNQINANRSMLRYASPTSAALQRNLAATNASAITALANAGIEGRKYNDALRKEVLGINNALELQRAANKMNVNQFNTNLANEYKRALTQRATDMAFRKYGLMNEVDAAVNAARDANRTAFLTNAGEAGKYWKVLNMIESDPYLMYAWLNGDHMTYKGRISRNGGCIKGRR